MRAPKTTSQLERNQLINTFQGPKPTSQLVFRVCSRQEVLAALDEDGNKIVGKHELPHWDRKGVSFLSVSDMGSSGIGAFRV